MALTALAPALASARRDDKPAELFRPSNGATVADATHGLTVDFSCPVYHQFSYDDVITAPTGGYHVILSTSDAVDANRLLVREGRVDERTVVTNDDILEHCTAAPNDA